jgi:hypothetical protein
LKISGDNTANGHQPYAGRQDFAFDCYISGLMENATAPPPAQNDLQSEEARRVMAERAIQLARAKAILQPILTLVVLSVFAICYWQFGVELLRSVFIALLAVPVTLIFVVLPVGFVLGTRAARRAKSRMRERGEFT